jgi:hypothetical protein
MGPEPRVRAHVFLCMLACHVEWHMRERLRPISVLQSAFFPRTT